MNDKSLILKCALAALILSVFGCAETHTEKKPADGNRNKFGYGGTNSDTQYADTNASTNAVTPPPDQLSVTNNPAANPFPTPSTQPAATAHDLPYGTPVPGKAGFVTSPHSPNAGYVDVRGFPPGTEVKDPYSGKIFLVP